MHLLLKSLAVIAEANCDLLVTHVVTDIDLLAADRAALVRLRRFDDLFYEFGLLRVSLPQLLEPFLSMGLWRISHRDSLY
jgi:hypothetical protein